MAINGLENCLNEPTRITNESKTCIDHVFVRLSDKGVVNVEASVRHLDITDHSLVQVQVCVLGGAEGSGAVPPRPSAPRCRTDYKRLEQLIDKYQFEQSKGNSKSTWKLVNKLTGQGRENDCQIKVQINDDDVVDEPFVVANEFNSFFLDI
ncbi:hypothetical protein J6590_106591, partial [Homalodisca vitripennis]